MDGNYRKYLGLAILALSITACNQPNTKQQVEIKPAEPKAQAKADFKQAAKYNVQLGIAYLQQGNTSRAKDKLNRAMKLAPELSEVHYAMAYFHEKIGESKSAEQEYKRSIAIHSGGKEHNNYGTFLCRQKQFAAADREFLLATKDPQYTETAQVYENAGLCKLDAKDMHAAETYFTKALSHDGRREQSLLELADIYVQQSEYSKANAKLVKFEKLSKPTARSTFLAWRVAKFFKDTNAQSSHELLLKNKFNRSYEYQQFLKLKHHNA